jgi:hypothetical protein
MTVTVSAVGSRYSLAKGMKKVADDKEYGIITNVKLTKISFMTWHLEFEVEKK